MDQAGLRGLFERGCAEDVLNCVRQTNLPNAETLFWGARAALEVGQEGQAEAFLREALPSWADRDPMRADALALLAFIRVRRGDEQGYLREAQCAAELMQTPLTLYHLGMADPDARRGLGVLETALLLAEKIGDQHAQVRNAYALALALERFGRFRQSLHWARYAEVRALSERMRLGVFNLRASLQILLGETEGLIEELYDALERLHETYPGAQEWLPTTLAELHQAEGRFQEAHYLYQSALSSAARWRWPSLTHGAVRALVALDRRAEARFLAESSITVSMDCSPIVRARAQLALGLALFPEASAIAPLEEALEIFAQKSAVHEAEALVHLAVLYQHHDAQGRHQAALERLGPIFDELGPSGRRLIGGCSATRLEPRQSQVKVHLLGQGRVEVNGAPLKIRPRGLEILALLLAHDGGLSGEALSEHLYSSNRPEAVRSEVTRLRTALGSGLESKPYRLCHPVWADLREMRQHLRAGRFKPALEAYGGVLLPNSDAPGIVELREQLESELKDTILETRDPDLIWSLAEAMPEEIEVWELLQNLLPERHPHQMVASGRLGFLRRELGG
jgi:tetratricopeptide (TPR) repeat protein